MPFTTTQNEPNPNKAKITITFAGLLLLRPKTERSGVTTCEIGIHKKSGAKHKFQVMLIVQKVTQPPVLIRLLDGPLTSPFTISVSPDPGTGVQLFEADTNPFDRSKETTNNKLDSRWKLNLKSLDKHDKADLNDDAKPFATLNAGVLYASNLSRKGLKPVLKKMVKEDREEKEPKVIVQELHQIADLAAEIPEGGTVTLAWHDSGEQQFLNLPRPGDLGEATYTIALINDPPISSPVNHDELEEYYKVITVDGQPIKDTDKFTLVYEAPNVKMDEIPCLPITLEP